MRLAEPRCSCLATFKPVIRETDMCQERSAEIEEKKKKRGKTEEQAVERESGEESEQRRN